VRRAVEWVMFVLSGIPPDDLDETTRQRLEAVMIVVCVAATAVVVYLSLLAISN
jgi:hypothetical protein